MKSTRVPDSSVDHIHLHIYIGDIEICTVINYK